MYSRHNTCSIMFQAQSKKMHSCCQGKYYGIFNYTGYLDNAGTWDIYCIMFKDLNAKQTGDAPQNSTVRCKKYSLLHQARFLDDHEIGKMKTTQECRLCLWGTDIQGGSNMTETDLYVNKPHCAAAVRPWDSEATTSTLPPVRVRTCSVLSGSC